MRTITTSLACFAAAVVLSGITGFAQQAPSASTPAASTPPATAKIDKGGEDGPNRLIGCVSPKADPAGTYTLTQAEGGARFRLTGKSLRQYAGKQVEIVTASGKGLSIRGGFTPSTNVAAQAGHIDSAQAAIANQPGGNSGKDETLPEIRVKEVRGLDGGCK